MLDNRFGGYNLSFCDRCRRFGGRCRRLGRIVDDVLVSEYHDTEFVPSFLNRFSRILLIQTTIHILANSHDCVLHNFLAIGCFSAVELEVGHVILFCELDGVLLVEFGGLVSIRSNQIHGDLVVFIKCVNFVEQPLDIYLLLLIFMEGLRSGEIKEYE
jgi:hypothetical protein